jgi:hypothetical protein
MEYIWADSHRTGGQLLLAAAPDRIAVALLYLTLIFFKPHGWQACDTRLRGRVSDDGAEGGVGVAMLAVESVILW